MRIQNFDIAIDGSTVNRTHEVSAPKSEHPNEVSIASTTSQIVLAFDNTLSGYAFHGNDIRMVTLMTVAIN